MVLTIFLIFSDVDECSDMTYTCSQTCDNTIGGYLCNCTEGFELHSDGSACNSKWFRIPVSYRTCFVAPTVYIIYRLYRSAYAAC